jgi:hypothetical protein
MMRRRAREARDADEKRKAEHLDRVERDNSIVMHLKDHRPDGLVCLACGRVMPMEMPLCPACGFGDAIAALRRRAGGDLHLLPPFPRQRLVESTLPWLLLAAITAGVLIGPGSPGFRSASHFLLGLLLVVLAAYAGTLAWSSTLVKRKGLVLTGAAVLIIGAVAPLFVRSQPGMIAAACSAGLGLAVTAWFIKDRCADVLVRRCTLVAVLATALIIAKHFRLF